MMRLEKTTTLPSGYIGVYRAADGKRWEACAMEDDLVVLGVYASPRAAAEARARYWAKRLRTAAKKSKKR